MIIINICVRLSLFLVQVHLPERMVMFDFVCVRVRACVFVHECACECMSAVVY